MILRGFNYDIYRIIRIYFLSTSFLSYFTADGYYAAVIMRKNVDVDYKKKYIYFNICIFWGNFVVQVKNNIILTVREYSFYKRWVYNSCIFIKISVNRSYKVTGNFCLLFIFQEYCSVKMYILYKKKIAHCVRFKNPIYKIRN